MQKLTLDAAMTGKEEVKEEKDETSSLNENALWSILKKGANKIFSSDGLCCSAVLSGSFFCVRSQFDR